jgi:hypothetical protein
LIGYSAQGFGKFGFYEIFKDVYVKVVGIDNAVKYQVVGYSISSACAEVIADCLLCPFEAVNPITSRRFNQWIGQGQNANNSSTWDVPN